MKKIKRFTLSNKIAAVLVTLLVIAVSMQPGTAFAADYNLDLGSVVKRDDGTVTVDWKPSTSTSWQQTTLVKDTSNPGQYVQQSNGQSSMFTWVAADKTASERTNYPSDFKIGVTGAVNGTVGIQNENGGYGVVSNNGKLIGYSFIDSVTQTEYQQMQTFLEQGMTRQEAAAAATQAQQEAAAAATQAQQEAAAAATQAQQQAAASASQECGVNGGTSFFECKGAGNPIEQVFLSIVKNLFLGVGIMCLIGVVMGGIVYASAGGDSGKTKQGITYVVNSIIGLIVFIGAYTLLNFMVPGNYFDRAGVDPVSTPDSEADPADANFGDFKQLPDNQ